MSWLQEAGARYGAVGAGLVIGTAARYGLALSEGRRLTRQSVIGDLLLLLLVGLAAVVLSDRLGLTGDLKAFASAMAAVSSDRLIKLLRARFEAEAETRVGPMAKAAIAADMAKVPAGSGLPDAIRAEAIDDDSPRALVGRNLRDANSKTVGARVPVDQIDLLRRLDGD